MSSPIEDNDVATECTLVRADGCRVHLIGTCHLSDDAARLTGDTIRALRPQTVVIELCDERREMLHRPPVGQPDDSADDTAETSLRSPGAAMGAVLLNWTELISVMYASFETLTQRNTGAEFAEALEAAEEVGARVVLGDRRASVTTSRMQRLVPLRELLLDVHLLQYDHSAQQAIRRARTLEGCISRADALQLRAAPACATGAAEPAHSADGAVAPAAGLADELRALRASIADAHRTSLADAVDGVVWRVLRKFWRKELIDETDKETLRWAMDRLGLIDPLAEAPFPGTMRRILVHERDQLLADSLARARGPVVVGVVGKAHVSGIERAFREGIEPAEQLDGYLHTPPWQPRPWHAGAAAALAGAAFGCVRSRAFRRSVGVTAAGLGVGLAWLNYEVRDRMRFFEHSQRQLSSRAAVARTIDAHE